MHKRVSGSNISWVRVAILCCFISALTAVVTFNVVTIQDIFSRPQVYVEISKRPDPILDDDSLSLSADVQPFGLIKSSLQISKKTLLITSSCDSILEKELNYLSSTLQQGTLHTVKHNCKQLSLPKTRLESKIVEWETPVDSDLTFIKVASYAGFCNNPKQAQEYRKKLDNLLNQLESVHGIAVIYRDSWSTYISVENQFQCAEEARMYGDAVDYFMQSHLEWTLEFEPFFDVENFNNMEPQPFPPVFVLRRRDNPMWKRLQTLQFPANCRDRPSRGSRPSFLMQTFWNAGFGSYSNQVAVGLTAGHVYDRTIIFDGDWKKYGHVGPECLGADLSPYCYFLNYTNCTGWDALAVYRDKAGDQNATFWRRLVWQQNIEDPEDVAMYAPDDIMLFFQIIPSEMKKQITEWGVPALNDFRLHTDEVTRPLLELGIRPRRWIREDLYKKRKLHAEIIERLVPNEYVAMHVRHGDKWKENPLPEFHSFMSHFLKRKLPQKTIYLATDDILVIEATSNYTEYEWVYLPMAREAGRAMSMLNTEQLKNRKDTMVTALLELEILSESSFVIGSANSNFSYLALRLFYYKQRLREGKLQDKDYSFTKHMLIM